MALRAKVAERPTPAAGDHEMAPRKRTPMIWIPLSGEVIRHLLRYLSEMDK
jgi:hypothetical protein